MRASASVTISTGKNLKVDRYGRTRNPVLTTQWHGLKFWMPPPSQNRHLAVHFKVQFVFVYHEGKLYTCSLSQI